LISTGIVGAFKLTWLFVGFKLKSGTGVALKMKGSSSYLTFLNSLLLVSRHGDYAIVGLNSVMSFS